MTGKQMQINISEDTNEGPSAPGRCRVLAPSGCKVVPRQLPCPPGIPHDPSGRDTQARRLFLLPSFLFQPSQETSLAHWIPKAWPPRASPQLSQLHGP